ncbi:hypothetical protein LTR17_016710 [Elasticomyces elasticus]|nr:hypothetical protein LTR17_016710 [Elasticomyces elasticus]
MNIKLDLSQRGAKSFVPETLADPQRASGVRTLNVTLQHSEAEVPYADHDRDAPSYVVRLRQHPSLTFDVLAAGQLLAELPNLQDLQLQGLSVESLQSQLDLGAIEALREAKGLKSKTRTLKVQCSLLTKDSLEELIRYLGPGLTHLTMRFIASADGGWHDVFRRIGELGLDRFVWGNLQYARNLSQEEKDGGTKGWQDVTVLDFRQRFDSYHEGYHHVVADSTSMDLHREIQQVTGNVIFDVFACETSSVEWLLVPQQCAHPAISEAMTSSAALPDSGLPPLAPVAPLLRLSTELVSEIADFLTLQDLRNFRFASRGVEDATHATWGRRAHLTLPLSDPDCRDFVSKMIASNQKASWVRRLRIVFQSGEPDEVAIGSLLAKLPKLRDLEIVRLSSVAMRSQFDLGPIHGAEDSQGLALRSLWLSDCSLTAEELLACVSAFSPTLRSLKLGHLLITTADWRMVLGEIGLLPLKQLSWYALLLSPAGKLAKMVFDRERYEKSFRTSEGIEFLVAWETHLDAHGSTAVSHGIEWALERLMC